MRLSASFIANQAGLEEMSLNHTTFGVRQRMKIR